MASVKKEAKSSKSREKRGKKQPKKPLKEANRPPCREEEAGLLSSGTEEGGEQDNALTAQEMEQVMEIVQRIQRKYVHKQDDVGNDETSDRAKELSPIISPSKKRQEEEEEEEILKGGLKVPTRNTDNKENRSFITPARTKKIAKKTEKLVYKEFEDEDETPEEVDTEATPRAKDDSDKFSHSILTPDYSSTPSSRREPTHKRYSHFGFGRLMESLDSPDSPLKPPLPSTPPANVDSFAFPSPSQSPPEVLASTSTEKKGRAVKALTFTDTTSSGSAVDHKGRKRQKGGKRKGKGNEFEEWVESVNKEFQEIEDYKLVID